MITLIIKSYFSIFLAVGIGTLVLIAVGLYCIIKVAKDNQATEKHTNLNSTDLTTTTKPYMEDNNSIASLVALTKPSSRDTLMQYGLDESSETYDDMTAIAGEDVVATQLDLARAFIETGKREAAVDILNTIIAEGSKLQQTEAKKLLQA